MLSHMATFNKTYLLLTLVFGIQIANTFLKFSKINK